MRGVGGVVAREYSAKSDNIQSIPFYAALILFIKN
jgi:hypothetical protein